MPEFLLKLESKNKESLGTVRCMEGLRAAEEENCIWIRGINALLEMDKELLRLPATNTFIIDEQNNLFLPGGLTPVAILKPLEWTSLTEFISAEAPIAALPGKTNDKVNIKIIPSATRKKRGSTTNDPRCMEAVCGNWIRNQAFGNKICSIGKK